MHYGSMKKSLQRFLGVVLVGMMALAIIVPSANALNWPGSGDWIFLFDDTHDKLPDDIDIRDVSYCTNATHVFFRVETNADFIFSAGTIAVVLNDPDYATDTYELAISSYRDGATNKAKGYYWDTVNDHWATEMAASADHIKCNGDMGTGLHGVQFAFTKTEMIEHYLLFNTDITPDVTITCYTTDHHTNYFEDSGNPTTCWYEQNTPGNWVDDDTTPYQIPEFSTLLIPIIGMIALFAIFRRYKKK